MSLKYSSAPADEPQDVTVNSLNCTAILIQWNPPLIPNGIILFYAIYINNNITFNISAVNQNSFMFGGLSPYQLLNVRLSASTKVGEGPLTESQSVTTDESGIDKGLLDKLSYSTLLTYLIHNRLGACSIRKVCRKKSGACIIIQTVYTTTSSPVGVW